MCMQMDTGQKWYSGGGREQWRLKHRHRSEHAPWSISNTRSSNQTSCGEYIRRTQSYTKPLLMTESRRPPSQARQAAVRPARFLQEGRKVLQPEALAARLHIHAVALSQRGAMCSRWALLECRREEAPRAAGAGGCTAGGRCVQEAQGAVQGAGPFDATLPSCCYNP